MTQITSKISLLDKLPLQTQIAILLAALLVTTMILYTGFGKNVYVSFATTSSKIKNDTRTLTNLKIQLQQLSTANKTNIKPKQDAIQMVLHTELNSILRKTLRKNKLSLLQIDNQSTQGSPITIANRRAFAHGLVLKFKGDYFTTLEYLKSLEQLNYLIIWDKIEYRVILILLPFSRHLE